LHFILPERSLVIVQEREGLNKVDEHKSEERELGCLRCDRLVRIVRLEWRTKVL